MKKLIGLVLLLTLSSCSYNTNFYIFNTTNDNITVKYQTRNKSESDPFVTDPKIVEFDSNFEIIEIKKAYDYEFEVENNIITCELKSGQAVWIGRDLNFTLDNAKEARILGDNLLKLTIEQNGRELIYADSKNIVDLFETLELQVVGVKIKKQAGNIM